MKISLDKVMDLLNTPGVNQKSPSETSLYNHIYYGLRAAILAGDLPLNCELPPTRKLAEALKISRSTLIKSYELLRLEGLIESRTGSGSTVSYKPRVAPALSSQTNTEDYPDLSALGAAFYANRGLVNPLDDSHISFRPGIPPLDVFPVQEWRKQSNQYWSMIRASELTYHNAVGMDALRISLANYLNLTRNIKCDYRQILIVGGSLQSLFIIGSLLLNEGDGIFMEEQSFPNVHSVFRGLRAEIKPVPLDEEGMNLSSINTDGPTNFKIIHATPSCQYPLGMQMSLNRRKDLVHFAKANNLYVLENEYEHEVNRAIDPLNSLFSTDLEDRTFYISTFNRILHPSVRIGFMIVPNHLIEPMSALIRHSHMFVSPSIQLVLRSFLEDKLLHKHIEKVGRATTERREIFNSILKNINNPNIRTEFFSVPSLHMLIHLPEDISDTDLVNRLKDKGVLVHALSKCAVGNQKMRGLIVGYASTRTQHMKVKLEILKKELNAL
jgi:GntR family transcriptional regulator/MocR family aminotransferase